MAIIKSDGTIKPIPEAELVEVEKARLKVDILNGLRTMGRIKLDVYANQLIKIGKQFGLEVE